VEEENHEQGPLKKRKRINVEEYSVQNKRRTGKKRLHTEEEEQGPPNKRKTGNSTNSRQIEDENAAEGDEDLEIVVQEEEFAIQEDDGPIVVSAAEFDRFIFFGCDLHMEAVRASFEQANLWPYVAEPPCSEEEQKTSLNSRCKLLASTK